MSAAEQAGQDILGRYVSGGMTDIAKTGLGAYEQALKGMTPEETFGWYQKYIAPEEQRVLKEELIPTFKESMVPGGTLRSTGTERGIADIIRGYGTAQMGRIGEQIMAERAGARQMMPYLGQMEQLQAGMPQVAAAQQYGALPRLLEQQELTAKLAEFVRTTPELSPVLDLAMNILQLQTQAAFYRPAEKAGITQLGEALAPVAGQALGGWLGGKALASALKPTIPTEGGV
jgi:hypothetical protein